MYFVCEVRFERDAGWNADSRWRLIADGPEPAPCLKASTAPHLSRRVIAESLVSLRDRPVWRDRKCETRFVPVAWSRRVLD
jgi:hypothetical protein